VQKFSEPANGFLPGEILIAGWDYAEAPMRKIMSFSGKRWPSRAYAPPPEGTFLARPANPRENFKVHSVYVGDQYPGISPPDILIAYVITLREVVRRSSTFSCRGGDFRGAVDPYN
jgi:hypothetical protein